MGRKLIIIFKIREKQEEQDVGGEAGVQTAWGDADPVQERNLELCSAKWDLCRDFPDHRWRLWRESKVIKNISVSL